MATQATQLEFSKQPKFVLRLMDSLFMIKRSSWHIIRNTDQLLGTFFQPIMFLVLFSAVFGGAISLALPPGINYISFLMAGIIVQSVAFGSTTTAISVCSDLQKGIVDRFRSLPMSNLAVVNGHVVSDVFRNAISTTIMIVVGLLLGFKAQATVVEWFYIAGILLLFTLAFSWVSAILGMVAKSVEAVQWLTFVIIFPLTFASTAFVPADSMTKYLQPFAENQPITQIINAVRDLMLGNPVGNTAWIAVAWCLGTLVVVIPLASWMFRRKTSS